MLKAVLLTFSVLGQDDAPVMGVLASTQPNAGYSPEKELKDMESLINRYKIAIKTKKEIL